MLNLLPVTPEQTDFDMAEEVYHLCDGTFPTADVAALFARHRQAHSLPGDVGQAWERLKARCCADPDKAKRCVIVSKEDFFAALTPSALSGDAGENAFRAGFRAGQDFVENCSTNHPMPNEEEALAIYRAALPSHQGPGDVIGNIASDIAAGLTESQRND